MRELLALAVVSGAALVAVSGSGAGKSPVACPKGALPFEANSIGPATTAALADDKPSNRPLVTGAMFAQYAGVRGTTAKVWCGQIVWQRTIVVDIQDRAFLPAESASQRVFFVARFANGYRVWARVH